MKSGLVMMEKQDLETHLNRIKDFTGSRVRMSNTTSSGTCSDDNCLDFLLDSDIAYSNVDLVCFFLSSCLRRRESKTLNRDLVELTMPKRSVWLVNGIRLLSFGISSKTNYDKIIKGYV
jgi:hypothetical protein